MKLVYLGILSFICSLSSAATVDINLSGAKSYFDIRQAERTLKGSVEKFEKAMKSHLEEQLVGMQGTLKVGFTNVDLAGEIDYSVSNQATEFRVLRNFARVQLEFDYEIIDPSGTTQSEGTADLSRFFPINNLESRRSRGEAFFFEKKLLDEWLSEQALIK